MGWTFSLLPSDLLRDRRPERPVLALRPHAARRAANWFLANFPGRVLYAAKANDAPVIIEALVEAGIRSFDVASLVEIERVARDPRRRALLHESDQVARSDRARLSRFRRAQLRLRQRRGARQDRAGDRRGARPRPVPPRWPVPTPTASFRSKASSVCRATRPRLCCCARARSRAGSASPSMWARRRWFRPPSARRSSRSAN